MFHYTVQSKRKVKEVLASIEENLKKESFGLLWQVNIEERIGEKDLSIGGDFVVLEVCNPFKAHDFLKKNKLMGYFLPCKIVVYEEDGLTKIGLPRLTSFLDLLEDESLREDAVEVEKILETIVKESI